MTILMIGVIFIECDLLVGDCLKCKYYNSCFFFRWLLFLLCTENFPVCLQAMYNEFSTANIQIDKDFSAKLSGYGCVGHIPEADVCSSSVVSALNSYEDNSIIVLVSDCKILLFLCIEME